MNRKYVTLMALAMGLSASAAAQAAPAQNPPATGAAQQQAATRPAALATGPTKIGIVNIQAAVVNTAEGKRELEALEKRFGPKQQELKGLNDEVENLKKQLTAAESKLSDEERATRARTIEQKQKTLQRNLEDAQGEFQAAQNEAFQRIFQKMEGVMTNFAKARGYDVVLDVSNPQTSAVVWASETTNITAELVSAYDQQHPVTASAPSAPSANRPAPAASRPASNPPAAQQQRPPATTPR